MVAVNSMARNAGGAIDVWLLPESSTWQEFCSTALVENLSSLCLLGSKGTLGSPPLRSAQRLRHVGDVGIAFPHSL